MNGLGSLWEAGPSIGYWGSLKKSPTALSFCGCVFINSSPFIWNQMLICQDLYDAWPRDKAHYFSLLPTGCFKSSLLSLIRGHYFILTLTILYTSFVLFSSGCLDYLAIWTLRKRQVFETFLVNSRWWCTISCSAKQRREQRSDLCETMVARNRPQNGDGNMAMDLFYRQIGMSFLVPDERYCWWKISRNHHLTCKPCK